MHHSVLASPPLPLPSLVPTLYPHSVYSPAPFSLLSAIYLVYLGIAHLNHLPHNAGPKMDWHRGRPARNAQPSTEAGCQSECPHLPHQLALGSICCPSATLINSPCSASPAPCSAPGKSSLGMSLLQNRPKVTKSLRTFGLALINGGTAGLFWNYIIAAIGLGFVYSSIAELASL